MRVEILNIGWKSKIALKRATFSISVNKLVAVGAGLQKGNELYCYLGKDDNERSVIIIYLDGLQRDAPSEKDVPNI